ncbi:MAG: dihydrofolate reductase family protein [Pseudomonadota bacterium]
MFIAASLDGYIARPSGAIDWLMKQKTEGEDHGYEYLMNSVDGLVMGRNTFETILTFGEWPYTKPVVVMSSELTQADIPKEFATKVRLSRLAPDDLMRELATEGWKRAYVDGGKVIQSFLRAGLISDITLTHIPILIGEGLPLFGYLPADIDLEHRATQSFPSGLVTSSYRVLDSNAPAGD